MLRVVRAAKHPDGAALAGEAEWFMDYWNSDGSFAEMCGNGVRVFVRYLLASTGWLPDGAELPAGHPGRPGRARVDGEAVAVDDAPPPAVRRLDHGAARRG